MVVPTSSEQKDDSSHDPRRDLVSTDTVAGTDISRSLFIGESSTHCMVPSRPAKNDHLINADLIEHENAEMGWKQIKRKTKKQRKKQAAREAAEAARRAANSTVSFGLSPITEEGQVQKSDTVIQEEGSQVELQSPNAQSPTVANPPGSDPSMVQETSEDICNSSVHDSSDEDPSNVEEPTSNKPNLHLTESLQDQLAKLLEDSPLPVGAKKPVKGSKTARKR